MEVDLSKHPGLQLELSVRTAKFEDTHRNSLELYPFWQMGLALVALLDIGQGVREAG